MNAVTVAFRQYEGRIVAIDPAHKVAQPIDAEGDRFFGLESGTNGTGPSMRRLSVAEGFTWQRHDGKHASGLALVPTGRSEGMNPWDGPMEHVS